MGRTYHNSDKEWENKSPIKAKVKKKKRRVKPPLNEVHSEENYYDDLEMEAYDDEFSEKIRRRGSNKL